MCMYLYNKTKRMKRWLENMALDGRCLCYGLAVRDWVQLFGIGEQNWAWSKASKAALASSEGAGKALRSRTQIKTSLLLPFHTRVFTFPMQYLGDERLGER